MDSIKWILKQLTKISYLLILMISREVLLWALFVFFLLSGIYFFQCSLVIVVKSSGDPLVYGLSFYLDSFFILKPVLINFCVGLYPKNLPVAFTFFVPFSCQLLLFFWKVEMPLVYIFIQWARSLCPLSFYLLLRKASVVKTADDWYLTGGCHYSWL